MSYEFAVVFENREQEEIEVIGFELWEDACAEVQKLFREQMEYYGVKIPDIEDDDGADLYADVYTDEDFEIMGYNKTEWFSAKLKENGVTLISVSAHRIYRG
jgi:hypothetical protein